MVADFVSVDYGWLRSIDGSKSTSVLFKAGKNREGYFTNSDIVEHATSTMNILEQDYSDEDHVFVFNNATTHQKQEEESLSATKMPKSSKEWGIVTDELDEDCNKVHSSDGKVLKMTVRMGDAKFANGTPQALYYPRGHLHEGLFKGMAEILVERGFTHAHRLNAQCKNFKCRRDTTDCCCRRLLYTQPDFVNVSSILEKHCRWRGFHVLFLPKFHCELNFIERCWGFSKRLYCQSPPSSKEVDLERNLVTALDSVPLETM